MLAAQRRAKVLERIRTHGGASLRDLSESLRVSLSTVRRDIDYLTESGHLTRTHGGAMLQGQFTTFEPDHDIAAATATAAKTAIGRAAAGLIQPNQSVIFDSGTTVQAAASAALARRVPFTAITNDLLIAQVLGASQSIPVIVIGGTLRAGSNTLLGPPGDGLLGTLHADLLLLGAHGLGNEAFSDTSMALANEKRAMIRAAERCVLLADGSKFGAQAFCDIAPYPDIDEIITEVPPAAEMTARLSRAGVRVTVAEAADR
ncbi:MAG: DeoR/GlpR family DNA-binding transcription regulator [Inquilinaceae bacterium]